MRRLHVWFHDNLNCSLVVLILGEIMKTNIRKQKRIINWTDIINGKLHFLISMVTLRLIYILMQQMLLTAVELKAYICANYTGIIDRSNVSLFI